MTSMSKQLTDLQLIAVAHEAGIEPAALKAFAEVESAGKGFLPDGRPKILFEGHIFWRQLRQLNIDPNRYAAQNPDIVYQTWSKSKYKGGAAEYDRLSRAATINKEAAYKSTSWGMFQIMGFNHGLCGYSSVFVFVDAMYSSELEQLKAAVQLLKSMQLVDALQARNWKLVASRYNGPLFASNKYDVRLEQAYKQHLKLNEIA